ncbi:MAG: hypothetical protein PUE98_00520 [Galactobacillus timonensis]|jgi:uncharacterized protein with gpF-like domain|uniref:hypothetical protein n=1 Tax=Galactobacillus timonensis TaxID=2041840 RepID=UPI000C81A81D|nr:hypothetical protein [Galactobacillus timonensis]MDY5222289.1 hypothetical protein [Lachnospiraceae bacterium]HCV54683.1 hypothetical protein [Erysipelotrichaceae bacterium]MCI6067818.1 hypothetical protein [Galactobacillus timonensis]MCI6753955.1 hypothetical protein [Galactobacillus timonensis]MDD5851311.1 hypothetical protein [Galactobacillus timonensis]
MEIEAIQDLISDDEETRKRIDELHEKRFRMKQEIEAEKKRLTEESRAAVNAQVEATRKELDEKIQKDEAASKAYFDRESEKLRSSFAENKEKWRKELVDRILSGEDE